MKIELNEQELQMVLGLLDAGVKSLGLNSVQGASHIVAKLTAAKQAEALEKAQKEEIK
jgi:hypothetical protein